MSKAKLTEVWDESFYYFNSKTLSFGGVWYSLDSGGWYVDQYQFDKNGAVINEGGALWDIEVDENEYIVDGYTGVMEVYEETMWFDDDNVEIDSDTFLELLDIVDDSLSVKFRLSNAISEIS